MVQQLSTNTFTTAKWIVSSAANVGTHTTIAGALTSSSSGDTIFILPGTYTENITLKAGVDLCAYDCDALTPNVIILGTCTMTTAGTVSISGIYLKTNSAFALAVTGSAASVVVLKNCVINCLNNTGISFTSSSASAAIDIYNCEASIGTTGITLIADSSAGQFIMKYTTVVNPGNSVTNMTKSAGSIYIYYSILNIGLTYSSSSTSTGISDSIFDNSANNTTMLTTSGTGTLNTERSTFGSGTASAISVGAGTTVALINCVVGSANAAAITGAGTLQYSPIVFTLSSSTVNVTTQTLLVVGPSATFGSSNSGLTNTLTLTNSSNTASSNALLNLTVGGTSANDAFATYTVAGTTNWSQGVDNSASDAFVLAASTALGTTNVMSVATTGEINFPLQSAFLVSVAAASDVTGDATLYTFTASGEIYDQNNDFSTPTFTAPVTGRYSFFESIQFSGVLVTHTLAQVSFLASNRTMNAFLGTAATTCSVSGALQICGAINVDMDAADTLTVTLQVSNGTKVVDIAGGFFGGYLIC